MPSIPPAAMPMPLPSNQYGFNLDTPSTSCPYPPVNASVNPSAPQEEQETEENSSPPTFNDYLEQKQPAYNPNFTKKE
jgi:hypothetical protein